MLVTEVLGDGMVVESPPYVVRDSAVLPSFRDPASYVDPSCALFDDNTIIPDSLVDICDPGFVNDNDDFVNDDNDFFNDNVEEVLDDALPEEVLDQVMFQTADELHDRIDLSLFSAAEAVQLDLLTTLNGIGAPNVAYDEVMKWAI